MAAWNHPVLLSKLRHGLCLSPQAITEHRTHAESFINTALSKERTLSAITSFKNNSKAFRHEKAFRMRPLYHTQGIPLVNPHVFLLSQNKLRNAPNRTSQHAYINVPAYPVGSAHLLVHSCDENRERMLRGLHSIVYIRPREIPLFEARLATKSFRGDAGDADGRRHATLT